MEDSDFTVVCILQICSVSHPAAHPIVTGDTSMGGKQQESEAEHLPPPSSKVKNRGAIL
jgi:hypothetical protein